MQRRTRTFHAGLLAAVLAATLQFVFMAGSLSGAFGPAAIAEAGHCSDTPQHGDHNDAACALCPVCLSLTLPGLLPPHAPDVPPPQAYAAAGTQPLAAARRALSAVLGAAYPRGPPLT